MKQKNMYLARNSNGCLWLFTEKPSRITAKNGSGFWTSDSPHMPVDKFISPYPRWQDEPIPVRLEADWIRESIKE